ncbi:MAG: DUF952 domain-containing protein [Pseudomonadota bacterium]
MVRDTVFKIFLTAEIVHFIEHGEYSGSADDRRDGFIHLSAGDQVRGTINVHFADKAGLFLGRCRAATLGSALKWEPSRGGSLFPHLYRSLTMSDVEVIIPVPAILDGWDFNF